MEDAFDFRMSKDTQNSNGLTGWEKFAIMVAIGGIVLTLISMVLEVI